VSDAGDDEFPVTLQLAEDMHERHGIGTAGQGDRDASATCDEPVLTDRP
jgi:hypothetical protein